MEKGFLTKATQDKIMDEFLAFLQAKEVKQAKLIVIAANVVLRLGDDVFAEKVDKEELKQKSRDLTEKVFVHGEIDIALIVDFILEIIDLFKK